MEPVNMLRAEYARSENALHWSLLLIALVNVLTIAQLYVVESWTWVLLSVGVLFQLLAFVLQLSSERHARLGQRFRHMALLSNAGLPFGAASSAALLAADADESSSSSVAEFAYYTSDESIPERRLIENVAESTFFSVYIARRAAKYLLVGAASFFLIVLYALVVAVFTEDTSHTRLAAHVALVVLAFVGAGDFLELAYRYSEVQIPGRALLAECDRLLASGTVSLTGSHGVLAEYEVLMANSPPLPGTIYRRHRERLTRAWEQRKEKTSGAATAEHSDRK